MNSRFKPFRDENGKELKKKYCDKTFKTRLVKGLKMNYGEPDNIEKAMRTWVLTLTFHFQSSTFCFRHTALKNYPLDKVAEIVNAISKDVQKNIEPHILQTNPSAEKTFELANLMRMDGEPKPQELPYLLSLIASNPMIPCFVYTNDVQFS
jgi:hypothetical protein